MSEENTNRLFERHIQTGIQLILIALCSWMALTVQSTAVEMAAVSERVASLQLQIDKLGDNNEAEIRDLRERVRRLETKSGDR